MSDKDYPVRVIYWGHASLEIQGTKIILSVGYGFDYPYARIQILEKCRDISGVIDVLKRFCTALEQDLYDPQKKEVIFPLDWKSTANRENYSWERTLTATFEIRQNGFPYLKINDEFFDSPGFKIKCELDSALPPDDLKMFTDKIQTTIQDLKDFEGYHYTEEEI